MTRAISSASSEWTSGSRTWYGRSKYVPATGKGCGRGKAGQLCFSASFFCTLMLHGGPDGFRKSGAGKGPGTAVMVMLEWREADERSGTVPGRMDLFFVLSLFLNNTGVAQCKDFLLIKMRITCIEQFHDKPFVDPKSDVLKNWYVPDGKKKDG
jgi:hypothetical protein